MAKEFKDGDQEGLFAATPPLEALKLILSIAATVDAEDHGEENVVMVNDVARAFFEAKVRRQVCVELPDEADTEGYAPGEAVGLLELSLYGTRDAAANFQQEVKDFMTKAAFKQSRYNPAMYYHPERNIRTLVHGDDFVTVARRKEAKWLKELLESRFEIKTKVIGTGPDEVKEARALNRLIRVTGGGWEYEADQRHAEIIVKSMGMESASGVASPGEDEKAWEAEEGERALPEREASEFRRLAARANYLALDRMDIQFAVKELCRGMAKPTKRHMSMLRRLARYLRAVPRVILEFRFQGRPSEITVYSDSDWAGCRRTAKSTSGGIIMRGAHCLKSWSCTQKNVTLSSAEAELVAAVKASTEALGMVQLEAEWGNKMNAEVYVDSSAALAVTAINGNSKLRHVKVGSLWIQERQLQGDLNLHKIQGTANPADALTKHLAGAKIWLHAERAGQRKELGRADLSLKISALRRRAAAARQMAAAEGECEDIPMYIGHP